MFEHLMRLARQDLSGRGLDYTQRDEHLRYINASFLNQLGN
jgi:hypothetical protein